MTNKEVTQVNSKREPERTQRQLRWAASRKAIRFGDVGLKPTTLVAASYCRHRENDK